eukprot:1703792-Rhodomonas_salina.2
MQYWGSLSLWQCGCSSTKSAFGLVHRLLTQSRALCRSAFCSVEKNFVYVVGVCVSQHARGPPRQNAQREVLVVVRCLPLNHGVKVGARRPGLVGRHRVRECHVCACVPVLVQTCAGEQLFCV